MKREKKHDFIGVKRGERKSSNIGLVFSLVMPKRENIIMKQVVPPSVCE